MSEEQNVPPPPPPSEQPPPPPPPKTGGSDNTLMLILSYLGLLALIPFLLEKEDKEVQWHAKHGLVLFVASFISLVVINFVLSIIPFLGCLVVPVTSLAVLALHVICIYKAINGERLLIPYVSEYADRF